MALGVAVLTALPVVWGLYAQGSFAAFALSGPTLGFGNTGRCAARGWWNAGWQALFLLLPAAAFVTLSLPAHVLERRVRARLPHTRRPPWRLEAARWVASSTTAAPLVALVVLETLALMLCR